MATLTQVARKAGVSLSTASVVLNPGRKSKYVSDDRAAKVRDAARELGYVVNYHARSLTMGLSRTIGIPLQIGGHIYEERSRLGNTYFSNLVGAAELSITERGFATTIIGPRGHEDSVLDRAHRAIRQHRIDGVIIPGVLPAVAGHPLISQFTSTPVVAIEYREPTEVPVVDWDEAAGLRLALDHLVELGHRRVLWVGPGTAPGAGTVTPREALFLKAASALGLAPLTLNYDRARARQSDPRRVSLAVRESDGAAQAVTRELAAHARRRFTAIVAFNDAAAIGVCRALFAAGLHVPREVSVVGIDDQHAALMAPKLTSVDHMLLEMGHRAAEMLLDMITDPGTREDDRGRRELITPVLVPRESTGPAPQDQP